MNDRRHRKGFDDWYHKRDSYEPQTCRGFRFGLEHRMSKMRTWEIRRRRDDAVARGDEALAFKLNAELDRRSGRTDWRGL